MESNYDPMFFLALMAKFGYTFVAWKAAEAPPMIPRWIPPRPLWRWPMSLTGGPLGDFEHDSSTGQF
jgi:hypothetical protein